MADMTYNSAHTFSSRRLSQNTSQRDRERETNEMGYIRREMDRMASDRKQWRSLVQLAFAPSEQTGIRENVKYITSFGLYINVMPDTIYTTLHIGLEITGKTQIHCTLCTTVHDFYNTCYTRLMKESPRHN